MTVHHIGYLVTDIGKSEKKFETLGYRPETGTVYDPYRDVDILFLTKDGYRIELVCPKSRDSVVGRLISTYRNTPYHICYETDDLEGELERLEADGFTRMDEPCEAPALSDRRVCFLMGSRTGMIELLEGNKTP